CARCLESASRWPRDRSSPRSAESAEDRDRGTNENHEREKSHMTPKPTGRLSGNDLVLTRTFRAPIDDVWTSVTRSESTARGFGPWGRVPGNDDKKIRIQMAYEEGKPWLDGTIERCDAPHLL